MICREYGWTWPQFLNTPEYVIRVLVETFNQSGAERK